MLKCNFLVRWHEICVEKGTSEWIAVAEIFFVDKFETEILIIYVLNSTEALNIEKNNLFVQFATECCGLGYFKAILNALDT